MLGSATVVGVLVVLLLIAVGVERHSVSVQDTGNGLPWMALLLTYGIAGIWVWQQSRPEVNDVHVANHVLESSVPVRLFVLIISPVFLMLALFGAAGSAAWERTQSLVLAVIAGVWYGPGSR